MIYIENDYVVMDYTDEIKEALGKLRKFMEKTKNHVKLQGRLFLSCDHNGGFVLFATNGAVLGMYRLETDVCIAEGKKLSLAWSTREIDENTKTIRFHFDECYCPDIKKLLSGWQASFEVYVNDRDSLLHFCKEIVAKKKTRNIRVVQFYKTDNHILCRGGEYGIDCEYSFDSLALDGLASGNSKTLNFFYHYSLIFNAQYFKTIVSCLKGTSFKFSFNSISSFVSFSEGNYRYLSMPRA